MNPNDIFADLTFEQYRNSRNSAPDITPTSWKMVYGPDVDKLEERYQALEKSLKESAYVRAGIEKSQREHFEGKADEPGHDIFGRPMRFGS